MPISKQQKRYSYPPQKETNLPAITFFPIPNTKQNKNKREQHQTKLLNIKKELKKLMRKVDFSLDKLVSSEANGELYRNLVQFKHQKSINQQLLLKLNSESVLTKDKILIYANLASDELEEVFEVSSNKLDIFNQVVNKINQAYNSYRTGILNKISEFYQKFTTNVADSASTCFIEDIQQFATMHFGQQCCKTEFELLQEMSASVMTPKRSSYNTLSDIDRSEQQSRKKIQDIIVTFNFIFQQLLFAIKNKDDEIENLLFMKLTVLGAATTLTEAVENKNLADINGKAINKTNLLVRKRLLNSFIALEELKFRKTVRQDNFAQILAAESAKTSHADRFASAFYFHHLPQSIQSELNQSDYNQLMLQLCELFIRQSELQRIHEIKTKKTSELIQHEQFQINNFIDIAQFKVMLSDFLIHGYVSLKNSSDTQPAFTKFIEQFSKIFILSLERLEITSENKINHEKYILQKLKDKKYKPSFYLFKNNQNLSNFLNTCIQAICENKKRAPQYFEKFKWDQSSIKKIFISTDIFFTTNLASQHDGHDSSQFRRLEHTKSAFNLNKK